MDIFFRLVDVAAVAGGDVKIALFRHFQKRTVHARVKLIVDIRKGQVFTGRRGEPGIARHRHALVFLFQYEHVLQALFPLVDNRKATVRRPVVHQDQFIAFQLLLLKALKELRKEFFAVIDGGYDA